MADILIRGMDMPPNCDECIYSSWSNFYQIYICNAVKTETPLLFDGKQIKSVAVKRSGRADNCPLIALPEEHGRLIDGDELASGCDEPYWCRWLSEIEDAPTVVPAELADALTTEQI